ncbi:MAG: DUF4012 domain-containing protein [Candidatus Andersenbacteria bacterium]|nr:DUF4012 domain-containing protein [Candidatus Andersenbacteria bacterium]
MYVASKPQFRVALPPYAGSVARTFSAVRAPSAPTLPRKSTQNVPAPKPVVRATVPARMGRMLAGPMVPSDTQAARSTFRFASTERDMPYDLDARVAQEYEQEVGEPLSEVAIEQPKRLFSLPFSLSFWPASLLTSKKKVQIPRLVSSGQDKRKNIAVLGLGCLLMMGLMWNLQGLGRGVAVLGSVQGKASKAYEKLLDAQVALAETDFATGEKQLLGANELLSQARNDLRNALSSAHYVLQAVDITGTVASGDSILAAGEYLTAAGQAISRGASAFFDVSFLPDASTSLERPITLVDAIAHARAEFEPALEDLLKAEAALKKVNSPLLPKEVQSQVATLHVAVPRIRTFIQGFQEQSDMILDLLGKDRQRQYLLLFANNDEIRPVGGFIGSLGLVNVSKGQVENIDVSSVYDPDGQLKEFIAPPDPLLSIVDRWYLRDANWFVDYSVSAKKIADFFEKEGGPTVDGVILMTPQVTQRLLEITGPIEMPAYGVTLTADNFSEVTQDQVTYSYDRELNKPKQFLADATPVLLNRLFGEGEQYGKVLSALGTSLMSKDLLFYFRDAEAQKKLVQAGWGGSLPQAAPGFLMVNNANIGGYKSDKFISQEIDYRVEVDAAGQAQAVVTVRRTHHGSEEGASLAHLGLENPALKDNIVYQRVLVPKGAQLLEAKGYTPPETIRRQLLTKQETPMVADLDLAGWQTSQIRDPSGTVIGQEAGYSFFSNWVVTKPGQTTVTLYRYALPQTYDLPGIVSSAQSIALTVQKQPGAQRTNLRASLKLPASTRIVHTVSQVGITQVADNEVVYRGELGTDMLIGAVYTGK